MTEGVGTVLPVREAAVGFVGYFLLYLGVIGLLIAVHEWGHYLAGWAGGISRRDMRVRLLAFPQHVVLRDGDRWVSPAEFWPYLEAMRRRLPTAGRLYLYTAGGLLAETAFTAAVCLGLLAAGLEEAAGVVASLSLMLLLIAVFVMDLPPAWRAGHPCGDVSGLWAIAKGPTAAFVAALVAVRAGLIWLALP